ncbi:MAG: DUF2585 domain-containing protein [Alphaproteobacteria bacterium]|nr:DUF2585 domain-containing protein [Alphaproteobacteria bacterium]
MTGRPKSGHDNRAAILRRLDPPPVWLCLLAIGGMLALQSLALLALGHPAICTCGTVKLWHGVVASSENSQHIADWYTYSHVIHGFALYFLLWLLAPGMSFGLRLTIAVGIEVAWEVAENMPAIMERYRQSALARGYFGDSAINSVADTLAAAVGVVLARKLPVWLIVASVIAMELFALYWIRDNLVLNVVQLIHPFEAISLWQEGGH